MALPALPSLEPAPRHKRRPRHCHRAVFSTSAIAAAATATALCAAFTASTHARPPSASTPEAWCQCRHHPAHHSPRRGLHRRGLQLHCQSAALSTTAFSTAPITNHRPQPSMHAPTHSPLPFPPPPSPSPPLLAVRAAGPNSGFRDTLTGAAPSPFLARCGRKE